MSDCAPAPGRARASERNDGGSAVVEFVWLGVLLLLPLVYLVVTLGRVQAAAFATDAAARAAARALTVAADDPTGRSRAVAAAGLALRDQGFDADPAVAARVDCSASPCLTPGARVRVEVTLQVPLPGVPAVLGRLARTEVTIRAAHDAVVDRFRDAPEAS